MPGVPGPAGLESARLVGRSGFPGGTPRRSAPLGGLLNLGRYEIVRELGKGAMGVVYLAKDPLIGRMVALKTLRTSLLDDDGDGEEFRVRFLREAQTAGILNHPAIVMIHDVGEDKATGISYIAMEYVEGKNLKQLVQEGMQFPFERIAEIVAQVAEGLDYAHAKAIVHRDVKPANIILTDDGKAKITDFGIAKVQSSNLTSTGQFLGTPNYMSPEQVSGQQVDHRSDLFSLGVCLYELLTRKKPFAGENLTSISYKIVHEAFVRPRDVRSELPDVFDSILDRALAKDPAKRYQRGKEIADDLRAAFAGKLAPAAAPAGTSVSGGDPISATRSGGPPPAPGARPAAATPSAKSTPTPAGGTPIAAGTVAARQRPSPPAAAPEPPAPPPAPRPTLRQMLRSEIYTKWVVAIVGGAAGLAAIFIAIFALQAVRERPGPVDTAWMQQTAHRKQLATDAAKLVDEGKYDAAELKLRELSLLSPDNARVRELRKKIEEALGHQLSVEKRKSEVERHITAARLLLEQEMYPESRDEARVALGLDPASAEASAALAAAEEAIAAKARGGQAGRRKSEPAAAPAIRNAISDEGGISGEATMALTFRTPKIGTGFLTVYFGDRQVFRGEVSFFKKTGILSKEEIGGELRKSVKVPAGRVKVRVQFVSPDHRIDLVETVDGTFPVGKSKALEVKLDEAGRNLSVRVG